MVGAAAVTGAAAAAAATALPARHPQAQCHKKLTLPHLTRPVPIAAAAVLTMLKLTSIAPFAPVAMRAPYLLRQFSSSSPFPKATSLVVHHTLTPQPK